MVVISDSLASMLINTAHATYLPPLRAHFFTGVHRKWWLYCEGRGGADQYREWTGGRASSSRCLSWQNRWKSTGLSFISAPYELNTYISPRFYGWWCWYNNCMANYNHCQGSSVIRNSRDQSYSPHAIQPPPWISFCFLWNLTGFLQAFPKTASALLAEFDGCVRQHGPLFVILPCFSTTCSVSFFTTETLWKRKQNWNKIPEGEKDGIDTVCLLIASLRNSPSGNAAQPVQEVFWKKHHVKAEMREFMSYRGTWSIGCFSVLAWKWHMYESVTNNNKNYSYSKA